MAEALIIPVTTDRSEVYRSLLPQLRSLVEDESNFIANVSNILAGISHSFQFLWTGCYFVENAELVLGPFQGPVACTRIQYGKGVCGMSWLKNETVIVEDVEKFPGHIACSSLSKSEIVVPLRTSKGDVFGVLDVDSKVIGDFGAVDAEYLQQVAVLISECFGE